MAVVGTATVRIVADTSSLEAQIKQAFSGMNTGDSEKNINASMDRMGSNASKKGKKAGDDFGGAFSKAVQDVDKNRKKAPFEDMISGLMAGMHQMAAMGSAMYGVVSAASDVVSSLFAVGSAALAAAPALLHLGNVFAALAQGLLVGKSLFSGVGGALKALDKQQKASSKSMEDAAAKALKQAQAQLALERATLANARAQEDATEAIEDAERALADALEAEQEAQENVADARKNAEEAIIDYKFALEDMALSEERAILNLKKAEKALAQARAGGNANAIYEADLAYREQELTLRKLQESNADQREEANKGIEEGVEGNEAVKDSLEDVEKATEAVEDAQRKLTRTMEDAPLKVRAAALALEQAMLGVKKASEPADKNAFDALNDAMDELSPAAQDFVRYWHGSVMPVFSEIKKLGQEEFFPNFQTAVATIMDSDFIPILEDMVVQTSRVLGEISVQLANTFTSTENLENLEAIFESNVFILQDLGDALDALITPLLQIGEALAPGAERMAAGIKSMAEEFEAFIGVAAGTTVTIDVEGVMTEMSQLEAWFYKAEVRLTALKDMFKSFGGGIKGSFEAALPAGDYLIEQITTMGQAWSDSFDPAVVGIEAATEKSEKMTEQFQASAENTVKLLDVLTDIGGILFRMGGSEGVGGILDSIKKILPELEPIMALGWDQIAGSISKIIEAIPGIAAAFAELNVIGNFIAILAQVFEWISNILGAIAASEIGQKILPIVGMVMAVVSALSLMYGMFAKINARMEKTGKMFKAMGELGAQIGNKVSRGFAKVTGRPPPPKRPKPPDADTAAARKSGADVGGGFADGLKSQLPEVRLAAQQLANAVIQVFRQIFRMSSPSLVMFDMGIDVVKGFVMGIRTAAPEVAIAMKQMLSGQTDDALRTGAMMGDAQMEAFQASVTANTAENMAAVRASLEGAAAPALAEGNQIGNMVGEGIESGIRLNTAENVAAVNASLAPAKAAGIPVGATIGNSVGEGIETGIRLNGPENTLAVKQSLAGGVAVARTEGAKMGNAAGNGLNKGLDDSGKKRKGGGGIGKLAGGLMGIAGIAMLLIPIFKNLWENNEGFRESVGGFIEKLMTFFSQLMTVLMPVFEAIMSAVMALFDALMPVFIMLADAFVTLFQAIGPLIVQVVQAIIPIFVMLVETIVPIFVQLIDLLMPIFTMFIDTLVPILVGLFEQLGPPLKELFDAIMLLMPTIMTLVETVLMAFMDILMALLPILIQLVMAVLPVFVQLIMALLPPFIQLVTAILPIIVDLFNLLLPPIIQLVTTLLPPLVSLFTIVVKIFIRLVEILLPILIPILEILIAVFVKIIEFILPPLITVLEIVINIFIWFIDIITWVVEALTTYIEWIMNVYRTIAEFLIPIIQAVITWFKDELVPAIQGVIQWFQDLWAAIKDVFQRISDFIKDVIGNIIGFFYELWWEIQIIWYKYGKPVLDAVKDAFQGVKDFIQGIVDGIKGIWESLIDIIKGPVETIVRGINDWLIKPLNSVLGVFGINIPEISVNFAAGGGYIGKGGIGGDEGGGFIRGPGGPTDDRIPTMLSDGEYVVRSRSVSKVGRKFLDHLNKTGELPGMGGSKDIGVGGLIDWATEVGKRGIAGAIGLVIDGGKALLSAFPNNKMTDWLEIILDKMKEWISDWATSKEGEMEAAVGDQEASGSGQSVGTYDGPPSGWTYPLSKKYPWYTRSNHSPGPGAYDVGSPTGTELRAVSSGKVTKSVDLGGKSYGQYIKISHADGSSSLYAHLSNRTVGVGAIVTTGQKIGLTGNSGGSSGPHLHFELAFPKDAISELKKRGVKMATGGVVSATPGGVLAVLAEAGRSERVTPLDANGRTSAEVEMMELVKGLYEANGLTVVNHIYPSEGMDERDLAVKISREVAYLKRRRS